MPSSIPFREDEGRTCSRPKRRGRRQLVMTRRDKRSSWEESVTPFPCLSWLFSASHHLSSDFVSCHHFKNRKAHSVHPMMTVRRDRNEGKKGTGERYACNTQKGAIKMERVPGARKMKNIIIPKCYSSACVRWGTVVASTPLIGHTLLPLPFISLLPLGKDSITRRVKGEKSWKTLSAANKRRLKGKTK